jgi:hypothetical protein
MPAIVLQLTAALALAACAAHDESAATADPAAAAPAGGTPATPVANTGAANVVTITATDYAFQAPDTIPAGLTTLRLAAQGQELHHATLIRLDPGKTLADFMQAMQAGGPPPAWMHEVGGPNPPAPGGHAETTQLLEPGEYVVVCFVPSPDGQPHVAKGMVKGLTVVPAAGPAAAEPVADVVMRLDDYKFTLSTPLTAGRHLIRVENDAEQPHEVSLVRLAPGKTAQEMVSWVEKPEGPPPGEPLGGVAGMRRGTVAYFPVDLTPGEYALVCFIPDHRDGKPHFAHGMIQQVTVR